MMSSSTPVRETSDDDLRAEVESLRWQVTELRAELKQAHVDLERAQRVQELEQAPHNLSSDDDGVPGAAEAIADVVRKLMSTDAMTVTKEAFVSNGDERCRLVVTARLHRAPA